MQFELILTHCHMVTRQSPMGGCAVLAIFANRGDAVAFAAEEGGTVRRITLADDVDVSTTED